MPRLGLNRQQLASFLKNQEAIVAFEQLFDFSAATPATIEEAAVLAGTAAAIANQALAMLADVTAMLEQLSAAPAPSAPAAPDDFTPPVIPATLGTLAEQDANNVAITGGAIDGTTIGATTPAAATFTNATATGVINAAGGQLKLERDLVDIPARRNWGWQTEVLAAGDMCLYVSPTNNTSPYTGACIAQWTVAGLSLKFGFGCNGAAAQTAAASGGPVATTAATNVSPYGFTTAAQADSIITKLNAIRAALVANGIMS